MRARFTAQFVLPEMIAHAFMTACFLLTFQVIAFLLNAPLLAYNVNKCVPATISRHDEFDIHSWLWQSCSPLSCIARVVNRNHMFDATEIFRTLGQHKKGMTSTSHIACARAVPPKSCPSGRSARRDRALGTGARYRTGLGT